VRGSNRAASIAGPEDGCCHAYLGQGHLANRQHEHSRDRRRHRRDQPSAEHPPGRRTRNRRHRAHPRGRYVYKLGGEEVIHEEEWSKLPEGERAMWEPADESTVLWRRKAW